MFLQFSHEDINEFAMGEYYVKNTGKPFEVADAVGEALLKSAHPINGESVPVFVRTVKGVEAEELTEANLNKKNKPALLKIAADLGTDATEDNNKDEIVKKILDKIGE